MQARCRPARSVPAARWGHGGGPCRTGGPGTVSTAAVRSPPRGAVSRPWAVSRCPGSSPRQAGSVASTSTRTGARRRWPRESVRTVDCAVTSRVAGRPGDPRTGRGSSRTTSSAVTGARSSTRARTGAASRTCSRAPVAVLPQTTPSSTATAIQPYRRTGVAGVPSTPHRCPASRAARTAAAAASSTAVRAVRCRQASAANQAATASPASRRSGTRSPVAGPPGSAVSTPAGAGPPAPCPPASSRPPAATLRRSWTGPQRPVTPSPGP